MEHTLLSILVAISLYNIDYTSNNGSIWLLLYVIVGISYIRLVKKIDYSLNIGKNLFTRINNFIFHISFVSILLIMIYWINWASLWEWKILHYVMVQYLVLIVYIFPVSLWLKIFNTKRLFKDVKNSGILSIIYLIMPTYLWNFKKNIPINFYVERFSKLDIAKLVLAFSFFVGMALYMIYFILHLIILAQERSNPVNYEIRSSNEGGIEYINNLK